MQPTAWGQSKFTLHRLSVWLQNSVPIMIVHPTTFNATECMWLKQVHASSAVSLALKNHVDYACLPHSGIFFQFVIISSEKTNSVTKDVTANPVNNRAVPC